MHGRGCTWQWICMVGGACVAGRGACMAGDWCMAGACVAEGHVWQGDMHVGHDFILFGSGQGKEATMNVL